MGSLAGFAGLKVIPKLSTALLITSCWCPTLFGLIPRFPQYYYYS